MDKKRIICLAMLLALAASPLIQADAAFSVEKYGVYDLQSRFAVINESNLVLTDVRVSLPVGVQSDSPYHEEIKWQVTPGPASFRTDAYGNRYAEVVLARLGPRERKEISVERTVRNTALRYRKDIYRLRADYADFWSDQARRCYLQPGVKIESDAGPIAARAAQFDARQTPARLAREIYDFVNLSLTYDPSPEYAHQGALHALLSGRGICDEYATLFTALSRAAGIPARVVYGFWLEKDLKADSWCDLGGDEHAWAEFYLPGAGWVPVEPTFFYTLNGVRTPHDDYFANTGATARHFITGYEPVEELKASYSYQVKAGAGPANKPQVELAAVRDLIRVVKD